MVRTIKCITLLLLLLMYSSSATAQVLLSIHDTSVVSGTKFTVPIYVETTLTGKGVTAYQIQLSYNTFFMTFDSVIASGSISQQLGQVNYNVTAPGTLIVASAGSLPLTGTGVLIYVRFKLLNSGNPTLSFSGGSSYNFLNEGDPPVELHNGNMNIQSAPSIYVYPASILLTVGDQQQFGVSGGVAPFHWSLTNLSVASIDSNGLLTATHTGLTRVVANDADGTIDTISGNIEIRPFRLSVRDTSYMQGQIFNLPIYASNLTGLNVTSGYFQIQFNQNILTPVGVDQAGTLLASYPASAFNNSANGLLSISFAGVTPLGGSGVLVYLQFKVSKTNSGASAVYPANIIFNEIIQGDSASGNFQTINLANLNVSPSSGNLIAGDTLQFAAAGGTSPYSWTTSDSTVASINTGGLLTALKGGSILVHAVDVYGGNGVSDTIQIYDTRASMSDTIGVIGDSVDLSISLSPITLGMHVQSLQATVTFDSTVVHLLSISNSGSITSGWLYSSNISGTQIIFAAATTANLASPGVVCKLRFVVPPYATAGRTSNIMFQQFVLNEGHPRVLAVNGSITASLVGLPAAPTSLNAVAINSNRIDLTWHDNATNETGYTVQRRTETTLTWSTIAYTAADSVSFSDIGVYDGTKYFYRIYASNGGGNSAPSNVTNAVTPMQPPTYLNAVQLEGAAIQLTWQDNSSSELGYYIERKLGPAGTYAVIDSVSSNVTAFTDSTGVPGNEYFFRVRAYNSDVASVYSNEVHLTLTGVKANGTGIPDKFGVSQNYPNPFNPTTVISYQLPVNSMVTLKVYSVIGKEIRTLVNGRESAGFHSAVFVASDLPSGVYFYRMQAGKFSETKKLMVIK